MSADAAVAGLGIVAERMSSICGDWTPVPVVRSGMSGPGPSGGFRLSATSFNQAGWSGVLADGDFWKRELVCARERWNNGGDLVFSFRFSEHQAAS